MEEDVFGYALDYLNAHNLRIYPPENFKDIYLKKAGISRNVGTAETISINTLEQLANVSKRAIRENAIPLRLGSSQGSKGTQFTIVKSSNVTDFFLIESDIFIQQEETYIPDSSLRDLFIFEIIHTFSENTLVNLALHSGLLQKALMLDPGSKLSSAITGYQSTFQFVFKPHSLDDTICMHYPGQVEIDAAFLGRREGKEHLFVIEAKSASRANTLAKHKLFYPVLALVSSNRIPKDISIIPVYLKARKVNKGWNFNIVQCDLPDPRIGETSLDQLIARKDTHVNLTLPLYIDKKA